jgi:hypothetical protein
MNRKPERRAQGEKVRRLVEVEVHWYIYLEQMLNCFRLRAGTLSEQQRWAARGYAHEDIRSIMKLTRLIRMLDERNENELADEMKRVLKQHLWLLHKCYRVGSPLSVVLH